MTMKNQNELYENIGSAIMFLFDIYDENGQVIQPKKQKPYLVQAIQNFSRDEGIETTELRGANLYALRTAQTSISVSGSFETGSFDPEVLAVVRGLKLNSGSTRVDSNYVQKVIPADGSLALDLAVGDKLVNVLNVVDLDNALGFKLVDTVPAQGEYSIDFVTNKLVFNVDDADTNIGILRMFDTASGRSFSAGDGQIGAVRKGVRMVVVFPYTNKNYVIENAVINSIAESNSNSEFSKLTIGYTGALSPINAKVYTDNYFA